MDGAESDIQEHLVVIENINKFLEQRLSTKIATGLKESCVSNA